MSRPGLPWLPPSGGSHSASTHPPASRSMAGCPGVPRLRRETETRGEKEARLPGLQVPPGADTPLFPAATEPSCERRPVGHGQGAGCVVRLTLECPGGPHSWEGSCL